MSFTNDDLKVMLDECLDELKALGYEPLLIESITFSRRASRNVDGRCKMSDDYYYDLVTRTPHNVIVKITINKPLAELADTKESRLRTLVMHEAIHSIKSETFLGEGVPQEREIFGTPHGERYDKIRHEVEKVYGYTGIDDRSPARFE